MSGGRRRHNKGIHPIRDTLPVIFAHGVGGRVMPGVRLLIELEMGRILLLAVLLSTCATLSLSAQESSKGPVVVEGSAACEENVVNLENLVTEARESGERIFVIAHPGRGEPSPRLTYRRLYNARRYLVVIRHLELKNLVFAEGAPINGKGRVEFYLGSRLVLVSVAERGKDLCVCCCEHERCNHYYGWGKR